MRRFIAISEKELELYYRHVALYGDPNSRNSDLVYGDKGKKPCNDETGTSNSKEEESVYSTDDDISMDLSDDELDSDDDMVMENEIDSDNELSEPETSSDCEELSDAELNVKDRGQN